MLAKRAASGAVIIVFGFLLVIAGGWIFTIGAALILTLAAWEYASMFRKGGFAPAVYLVTAATFFTACAARFENFEFFLLGISLFTLASITWHVFTYASHEQTAAIDLAADLSALVFIALMGSYIVRLRFLPNGFFWLLIAIAPAGISDIGAFLIGSAIGRHKLAPQLSPGKTIEGYLGGLLTAGATGWAVGAIASLYTTSISASDGLIIGMVVGILCPLGDLGKSILKRQFSLKDTSSLIPGHGGVLDRVDTWLWAGVVSYYLIKAFFL